MIKRAARKASALTPLILTVLIICTLVIIVSTMLFHGIASSTVNDQVLMICHEHYINDDGITVTKMQDSKYGTIITSTSQDVYDSVSNENRLVMNVRISTFGDGSVDYKYSLSNDN